MMMLEYDSIGLCRRTRGRVEQTGQSCWKWFFFCHITECPLLPTKRRSWRHNLKTASVCLWCTWVCVLRSPGELFIIRITQTAKLLRWQGHLDFFETVSVSAWPLGLFIHAVCRFAIFINSFWGNWHFGSIFMSRSTPRHGSEICFRFVSRRAGS